VTNIENYFMVSEDQYLLGVSTALWNGTFANTISIGLVLEWRKSRKIQSYPKQIDAFAFLRSRN